jgi:hypothetical protein
VGWKREGAVEEEEEAGEAVSPWEGGERQRRGGGERSESRSREGERGWTDGDARRQGVNEIERMVDTGWGGGVTASQARTSRIFNRIQSKIRVRTFRCLLPINMKCDGLW